MREEGVFLEAQRFQVNTKLNASEFGEFEINLPSLFEQRRIIEEWGTIQAKIDMLKTMQFGTAVELGAMMPAILDRAFRGEL